MAVMPLTAASSTPISPTLTARELVDQMGTGWNLGNTFDAGEGPTGIPSWLGGNPTLAQLETFWLPQLNRSEHLTSLTLIQAVKAQGFDTIRIPVTWYKVADRTNDWQIRTDWMNRIKQVVRWALDEDMFVILNTHHEEEVLPLNNAGREAANKFVTDIWTQIANAFEEFDERLIFEGLNEPRVKGSANGEWTGGTAEFRANLNRLNQSFVTAVRNTGGNNANRILMIPTYAAGATTDALADFRIPTDLPQHQITLPGTDNIGNSFAGNNPVTGAVTNNNIGSRKIVLSMHTYSPFEWAHNGNGTYGGLSSIESDLDNVQERADALGVPVILGEWGSVSTSTPAGARATHASDYVFAAKERGMVAVWWDNGAGASGTHGFGLINRRPQTSHEVFHPAVVAGIKQGLARAAKLPVTIVTNVTASQQTISSGGGASTITITGTNLPSGITVSAAGATTITNTTTGSATSQSATLTFPANTTGASRNYSVSLSHPSIVGSGAAWTTVTVLHAGSSCGGKETLIPLGAPTMDTTGDRSHMQRGWNLNATNFNAATHFNISWSGTHAGNVTVILNGGGNDPGWQQTSNVPRGRIALSDLRGYSTLTGLPQLFVQLNPIANLGTISISYVIPPCGVCDDCVPLVIPCTHTRSTADCTKCANTDCDYVFDSSSCGLPKCAACQAKCTHTNRKIVNCAECADCGAALLTPNCGATCTACQCTHTASTANCTICSKCSSVFASHTAGAAATCTTAQTCTKCPYVFVPAGHTAGAAATCLTAQVCTKCPVTLNAVLGHNMPTTWTVRTPATTAAAGVEVKICQRSGCVHEVTQEIPRKTNTGGGGGGGGGGSTTTTTPEAPSPAVQQVTGITNVIVNIPVTIINNINVNIPVTQLKVPDGATGTRNVTVGSEFAGQRAVLVKYNSASRQLEYVSHATVGESGNASLNVAQSGDFLVQTFIIGDITGTGKVETADALALLRHIAGIAPLNSVQLFVANGKVGDVGTADALNILRIVAGL